MSPPIVRIFLICLILGPILTVSAMSRLKWDARVIEYNNDLLLPTPTGTPIPVSYASPNMDYLIRIRILFAETGAVCTECALELSRIGGFPIVSTDASSIESFNSSIWSQNYTGAVTFDKRFGQWYMPFPTLNPGTVLLKIVPPKFSSPILSTYGLASTTIPLTIAWFSQRESAGVYTSFLGTVSPSLPTYDQVNLSTLQISYIPRTSSDWIVTFSSSPESFAIITDDTFTTFNTLSVAIPAIITSKCSNAPGGDAIISGAIRTNDILFHTPAGLITKSVSSPESWSNILPECISKVSYHRQDPVFNVSECSPVLAMSDDVGKVWKMQSESRKEFEELKTNDGKSFVNAFGLTLGDFDFVGAGVSGAECHLSQVLVRMSNGSYFLTSFNVTAKQWKTLFLFPTQIPVDSQNILNNMIFNENDAEAGEALNQWIDDAAIAKDNLVLTGMGYHRLLSKDLFFWGNALLYSPNSGQTVYAIKVFTNGITIDEFVSASNGRYAIVTSDYQVYMGSLGTTSLVLLRPSRSDSKHYSVVFDEDDVLVEVAASVNATTGSILMERTIIDVDTIIDYAELSAGRKCPYDFVSFDFPEEKHFTLGTKITDSLPESVFLQYGMSYTFTVTMKPASGFTHEDLNLDTLLTPTDYFNVTSIKTVNQLTGSVVYTVIVTDKQVTRGQFNPGENLAPTTLKFSVANTNLACKRFSAADNQWASSPMYSIVFYSGCSPRQSISLNMSAQPFEFCPNQQPGEPCLFFETDFVPTFTLNNLAIGSSQIFEGGYTLRLVGGGETKDMITMFSPDVISLINPVEETDAKRAPALAWTTVGDHWVSGLPAFNYQANALSFVCRAGSPCYGISPQASSTAEYYFLFEMSSNVIDRQRSYCAHKLTFVVRAFGLPLEFNRSVTATVTTVFVGLAVAVLFSAWRYHEEKKQFGKVDPNQGQNGPSENIFDGGMEGYIPRKNLVVGGYEYTIPSSTKRADKVDQSDNLDVHVDYSYSNSMLNTSAIPSVHSSEKKQTVTNQQPESKKMNTLNPGTSIALTVPSTRVSDASSS